MGSGPRPSAHVDDAWARFHRASSALAAEERLDPALADKSEIEALENVASAKRPSRVRRDRIDDNPGYAERLHDVAGNRHPDPREDEARDARQRLLRAVQGHHSVNPAVLPVPPWCSFRPLHVE